jgi:peptidyl-tRNA hydrolase, PTH1 family
VSGKATTSNNLTAWVRTETGKGASRRARRDGKVPAVLYGHHSDPQHLLLSAHDFSAVLRHSGTNAVLILDINGKEQLALTKALDIHPIRRSIQHADLLVVRRGEKVTVEVNVATEGEAVSGTLVTQETTAVEIEAEALSIPEQLTVSIEGAEAGTQITAGQIVLPAGVTLASDPELLVINVVIAPTAEDLDAEGAGEPEGAAAPAAPGMAEPVLVVGLGNPGPNYAKTRHNLGYLVAGILADRIGAPLKVHKKSGADAVTGRLGGRPAIVARPRVYMNESGRQVGPLAKFYSVAPADVIVVHDELDIEFGRIRLKLGGGEGGHNGLRSVAAALGTKDFRRVRIGIGRPPGRKDPAAFVLENFTSAERPEVPTICELAADATELLVQFGLESAQNTVHAWNRPPD